MSLVQTKTTAAGATANTSVVAFDTSVVAGNLIIVATQYYHGAATPTCADSRGTAYTRVQQDFFDSTHLAVFYGVAPSSGANTVTVSAASSGFWITAIHEFSDVGAFDASVGASFDSSSSPQNSGNLTTSQAGDLLFGAIAGYHNGSTFTTSSGGDTLATFTNGADALETQYRLGGAAGTDSMNFAQSGNDHGGILLLAFLPIPAPTSALKRNANLNGLGGCGPFVDPLG